MSFYTARVIRYRFGRDRLSTNVRFASLLDHLIGASEQRRRHVEPKRAGGGQIDDEIELGRLYHGKSAGLGALENVTGIDTDLAIGFGDVGPVAHQAAGFGVRAQVIDGG